MASLVRPRLRLGLGYASGKSTLNSSNRDFSLNTANMLDHVPSRHTIFEKCFWHTQTLRDSEMDLVAALKKETRRSLSSVNRRLREAKEKGFLEE